MELTFTWNTVRMAAGNVSKLVVGVSSSKLNLQRKNEQSLNVIKLQSHIVTFTPPPMEDGASYCPLHQATAYYSRVIYSMPIIFVSSYSLCDLMADLWAFLLLKWMGCAKADILYLCVSTGTLLRPPWSWRTQRDGAEFAYCFWKKEK